MTRDQTGEPTPLQTRYGLVRPLQGRYVAGVGAALGRATRTDPVLWRVVLAVLVCFGGLGILIYLLVWLLAPEEGDSGSPAESLLGRGMSSTSPVITVLLGLVAAALIVLILPRPFYVVLGGAVVLAVLLLIKRPPAGAAPPYPAGPPFGSASGWADPPVAWPSVPPGPGGPPMAAAPPMAHAAPPMAHAWPSVADVPPSVADAPPSVADAPPGATAPAGPAAPGPPSPAPGLPPLGPGAAGAGWYYPATGPTFPPPGGTVRPASGGAGYRPPFAPHGPFGGPPPPPPPPPRSPAPPRERSRLPAITFFAGLLALGILGAVDAGGAVDVPLAGYLAAALAVVGAGLLVGAWLGRARPLIALGSVLALALPVAQAVETWEPAEYAFNEFTWTPESRAEIEDDYTLMLGAGVLDLREVDFTDEEVTVAVHVSFGEIQIIAPDDVTVEAAVNARFGNATIFGTSVEGVTDDVVRVAGTAPGSGTLLLDLQVRFAHLEVY